MRRFALALLAATALTLPAPAQAEFGVQRFDLASVNQDETAAIGAGTHPFAVAGELRLNSHLTEYLGDEIEVPDGDARDVAVYLPPGLIGNPTAVPSCPSAEFFAKPTACPPTTQIGVTRTEIGIFEGSGGSTFFEDRIYNLTRPPGVAQKFGFLAAGAFPVIANARLSPNPPYNVITPFAEIADFAPLLGSKLTLWGIPASSVHDQARGGPVPIVVKPYLTLPRSCQGPQPVDYALDSWQQPGAFLAAGEPDLTDPSWVTGQVLTHGDAGPQGYIGCGKLGLEPAITAQPTAKAASSPTGLDFALDINDEGLGSVKDGATAASDIRKAVVTLPEGMSANPSLAEGLEVCTMAQLERESATSEPGEGCPDAAKIGTAEVESPLLEEKILKGALYVAKPYENFADNSLIALYLVIQNRDLGISVKQPLRVEPDPVTGQLTTVAEELPQLPFSHFRLHFREGTRSPLVTPRACGAYNATATFYPWSGGSPVTSTSTFQIISGPNEGPCPSGGLPPFKPGLIAGTNNNRAGSFSPFYLRLHRSDSEQEITHFSIKLPPGITGKLAGIPYCSDAAIEAAKARTGPHGGQEELDDPSCPAASEIGRTLAGAGVGPSLTYAPGKVYLAGPYNGSNLSMVAITAGRVGPFDIGTVVVREAFRIDPETAEVFIDSTGSDPIPHIIRGIPVHLRDIRAYVDRPEFVLNPTDCTATSTASTVLGSGLDFVSEADDNPITVTSRFQAADCAALTFAPRLSFRLIGGTKRGKFPKLVSHLQMNGIGESGIANASVILPRSEFIEQGHFNNICTRVQFKEGAGNGASCPAGSIYGHARAVTPILSEPLEGPVMLRSNPERQLPDVVAALHNAQVDFDLVGNVDSVKGQLRTTFAQAPDAPVTSFDLELEGGKKGLFVNSTNLCLKKHFVAVAFGGQNGKQFTTKPVLQAKCKGKAKRHRRHARKRGRR